MPPARGRLDFLHFYAETRSVEDIESGLGGDEGRRGGGGLLILAFQGDTHYKIQILFIQGHYCILHVRRRGLRGTPFSRLIVSSALQKTCAEEERGGCRARRAGEGNAATNDTLEVPRSVIR